MIKLIKKCMNKMAISNKFDFPVTQLRQDNYDAWKFRINAVFVMKQLDNLFVYNLPDRTSADSNDFLKKHKLMMAFLTCSVFDELLGLLEEKITAKQMCKAITDIFSMTGAVGKLYLRREFLSLRHSFRDKLKDFLLKFDTVVTKMSNSGSKLNDEDIILQLLYAIPQEFGNVITAIETLSAKDKDIKIDFVKDRLLEEEVKIKQSAKSRQFSSHSFDTAFLTCYNCGKQGHKKNKCLNKNRKNNLKF